MIENGDTLALVRIERIKYANYLIDISQKQISVYEEMIVNYDVQVESLLDMLKNRGEVIARQDTIIQSHVDINITQKEIISQLHSMVRRKNIINYVIGGVYIISGVAILFGASPVIIVVSGTAIILLIIAL